MIPKVRVQVKGNIYGRVTASGYTERLCGLERENHAVFFSGFGRHLNRNQ
jgi:hypothetical protein